MRLQLAANTRDLGLFDLAIDSKLCGSDLVRIKVSDIANVGVLSARAMVLQQKTGRSLQFEKTERTQKAQLTGRHMQSSVALATCFRFTSKPNFMALVARF